MSKKPFILSCMVVLLILSLVGCGKQNKQYGYAPMFDKLTWGMSLDEVVSTLQLTKQNAKIVEPKEDSAYYIIRLNNTYEKYGVKTTVNLLITDGEISEQDKYSYPVNALSAVVLQYANFDAGTLKSNMEEELGSPDSAKTDTSGEVIVWKSKDLISSLSKAERKDLNSSCEELEARGNKNLSLKEKSSINKITLTISDDGKKAIVTYFGDWAVYIDYSRNLKN
ncbi:hypothetical protein [Anaerosporobacter sp.]